MEKRESWIDQARGLAMFLVVYGHNFPQSEQYVYSFHMPLFLLISGFFIKKSIDFEQVKHRFRTIILPYFSWAFFLFVFWAVIGKKMGDSSALDLSVSNGFLGVLYAQGDRPYMDWGIPMWFLPCIFMVFFLLYLLSFIKTENLKIFVGAIAVLLGFLYARFINVPLFWSIDVALVSLLFVGMGKWVFRFNDSLGKWQSIILMVVFFVLNFLLFNVNDKVDMYRSIYGTEFLFIINAFTGSFFVLLFFKNFPYFKFLNIIGKMTIVVLALHLLAMSAIKFFIVYILGNSIEEFSEIEKFLFSIVQILLIIPVGIFINRYIPFLNGGFKKI